MPVLSPPPGFPQLSDLCRRIAQTFAPLIPTAPVNLPTFTSSTLPDPAKYKAGLIFVSDINTAAVSTGEHWLPFHTDAAL